MTKWLMHQRHTAAQARAFGGEPIEHREIGLVEAGRKQRDRRRNDNRRARNHLADRFHAEQILIHLTFHRRLLLWSHVLWSHIPFGKPASTFPEHAPVELCSSCRAAHESTQQAWTA